jgi:hypothetical protein
MSKGMFNGNGSGRQWDFMCGPVGDPGCHKPTMTGDGKHTTHKNGDGDGLWH